MNGIIAIVGATATGKSRLAVELARATDGEVVNADSRQVYRYMDIGTAKPSPGEMERVPHHLIDILDPDESFNLALYLEKATEIIDDIHGRGKVPYLVGGSGLYVWGLIEGLKIPHVPPDDKLRNELEMEARLRGSRSLHDRLREVDSAAADSIDPNNIRRVIRALEVFIKSGTPFSQLVSKNGVSRSSLIVGLTASREVLYSRIDSRVDDMISGGLVNEVRDLLNRGYTFDLPSMSSVGYKQIGMYLKGQLSLEEAIRQTKHETHRLARHQGAWFKSSDRRISWHNITEDALEPVLSQVRVFCDDSRWEVTTTQGYG